MDPGLPPQVEPGVDVVPRPPTYTRGPGRLVVVAMLLLFGCLGSSLAALAFFGLAQDAQAGAGDSAAVSLFHDYAAIFQAVAWLCGLLWLPCLLWAIALCAANPRPSGSVGD